MAASASERRTYPAIDVDASSTRDDRVDNVSGNPMAALLSTASSSICAPNSLSQEVGLGLGAQAGEAHLRQVFEEAGSDHFRRAAETPLNLILEARVE